MGQFELRELMTLALGGIIAAYVVYIAWKTLK